MFAKEVWACARPKIWPAVIGCLLTVLTLAAIPVVL
jgi:hypothetical protein